MAVCNKYLPKFETIHTLRDYPSIQLKGKSREDRTKIKKRKHDEIENKSQWFSISRSNSIKFIIMNGRAELCWAHLLLHLSSIHLFFIFSVLFNTLYLRAFIVSKKFEARVRLSQFIVVHFCSSFRFQFYWTLSRSCVSRGRTLNACERSREEKKSLMHGIYHLSLPNKKLHNSNSTKEQGTE